MQIFGIFLWAFVFGVAQAETIFIKKLQTEEAIRQEYCRVSTGSDAAPSSENCGMQYGEKRLEVIYLPLSMAQKIAQHVASAFDKNYYFNLDKKDFFHGHFLARGPRTIYQSAADYLSDVQVILYHSQEYLHNWEPIDGDDPFVPHQQQRSFVGRFDNSAGSVDAAIDLIDRALYPKPYKMGDLRVYKIAGTIYTSEINRSLNVSLHEGLSEGKRVDLLMATDSLERKHCQIFEQVYILEEPKGRFTSPDGKKFDITIHCRYRRT